MTDFSIEEPTCQELAEYLTDYLEGVLPPSHRLNFDRHIAECRDCTLYIEQMRATIVATGQMRSELLAAFRGWAHRPR